MDIVGDKCRESAQVSWLSTLVKTDDWSCAKPLWATNSAF